MIFRKTLLPVLLIAFSSVCGFAQVKVTTSVDTVRGKVGSQFTLSLKSVADSSASVIFPAGKNFGALEVIRSYPVDTIKRNAQFELTKRYGLTQFDSGKFVIPKLSVIIAGRKYPTDSIAVKVSSVEVDTLKQKLYDIKDIVQVERGINWWKYLLFAVMAAVAGYGVYWLIQYLKRKKAESQTQKTPIEKATTLLQQLERKELWQKGEVKNYYSELTDIARNYIEEAIHIPAMESTTTELIVALRTAAVEKKMSISPEIVANLEKVLRQADLVKFAKSRPMEYEISDDRAKIEKAIVTLDEAIPEEIEDDSLEQTELLRKKMLQRERRQKFAIAGAIVLSLLILTVGYFSITKGFGYVRDTVFGHPTRGLVDGEWILSEYGNPSISIETPRVLKRVAGEKLPAKSMAIVKDFQLFSFGSIKDEFYVMVSTNTYKGEGQVELEKALEGFINTLELQGARNMLVKNETYETGNGISGIKAFGTMTHKNSSSGDKTKYYYEIMLFGQQNGLQQVMVAHRDDDEFGKQIAKRIMNSVELKQVQP